MKTWKYLVIMACLIVTVVGVFRIGDMYLGREMKPKYRTSRALWVYSARDAATMIRDVDLIAVARLVETSPGRIVTSRIPGVPPTRFEINSFVVDEIIKAPGDSSQDSFVGPTVTVERLGDATARQASIPSQKPFEEDGGAFAENVRYLLMLKKQPGTNHFIQVNHEGRYTVDATEALMSDFDGPVISELRGTRLNRLRSLARSVSNR